MTILIVDQFSTPEWEGTKTLHQLIEEMQTAHTDRVAALKAKYGPNVWVGRPPTVQEVDEDFQPEMATTTFREVNGKAARWRYRWDSSG